MSSEYTFEVPIDLSELEIKRVRLHHWGATPAALAPSGKIGYNSGITYRSRGLPEWSDGTEWHQIWPTYVPLVRAGFPVVVNEELTVDTVNAYLNGIAYKADNLSVPITINLAGKAIGTGSIETAGETRTITVTSLVGVEASEISVANGKLITGTIGGVGTQINRSDIRLNEWGQPNADIVFNGSTTISGVRDPVLNSEVANRGWVLGIVSGIAPKTPVRLATTAALPAYDAPVGGAATVITASANGALSVGGLPVVVGDRILVKDEAGANRKWNGVYTVTTAGTADPGGAKYVITRATDADSDIEVGTGDEYFVSSGDNGGTSWALQTAEPITVGTTELVFVQTSGGGEYTAGNGLVIVGRKFHFAQSGNYTAKSVPYATGLTTIGFTGAGSQSNVFVAGADGTPGWGQVDLASAAAVTGVLTVPNGGTGRGTLDSAAIMIGAGTSQVGLIASVATGNVVISKGIGVAPEFGKVVLGGSSPTHVSGTLQVANGGTGRATITQYGVLYGNGTGAIAVTDAGVSGRILQASAGGSLQEPAFVAVSGDATIAVGGALTIAANAVLFSKMQDLNANVVIGQQQLGGDPIEIAATTNGHVLRRESGILAFGTLSLTGDTFAGSILPTTRGGTGLNAPLEFVPHGGQVPHFRKVTLAAGSQTYTIPHGYTNRHVIASLVRSDGRVISASITIDDTNVTVVFGFVTTSSYKLMLCGHTAGDTWAP